MKGKKSISWLLSILVVTLVLSGCQKASSQSSSSVSSVAQVTATAAAPVEITYLHWRVEDKVQWEQIIANFNKDNPTIKVKMEMVPTSDYQKVLTMRIFANETSDLFTANPGAPFRSYVEAGACMDLSSQKELLDYYADFAKSGKTMINGKTYGVLYTYNVMALYYNKEIFKKYNISAPFKSWKELEDACSILKTNSVTPIISGFGDFPAAWTMFALTTNLDKDFHETYRKLCTGEVKLNEIQSLIQGIGLVRGLKQKGYYENNMASTKNDVMLSTFAQGKAAMMVCGTFSMGTIRTQNPNTDFGLMNMPNVEGLAKTSLNMGAIHCINSKTTHLNETIKFLMFASSKEQASLMANGTGQMIAVKDIAYTNKDFNAVQELRNNPGGEEPYMYYDFTNTQVYAEFSNAYTESIINDKEDVVTILKKHQNEIDKVLKAASSASSSSASK